MYDGLPEYQGFYMNTHPGSDTGMADHHKVCKVSPPSPPPPPPKLATNVVCLPTRSDEALLEFSGAKPQRFLHLCSPPG